MSRRTPIRVLVAEDDPAVRDALAGLIRSEGELELVAAVPDAATAVDTAARELPDIALIDVRMPGGGATAARGILRRSPETKVLALSAHDDRATVLEMLEAGVVGYLVKGSSVETIVESVLNAAAGQGSLSVEVTGDVIEELVGQLSVRRRSADRHRLRESRIRRALEQEDVLSMVFQPICTLAGRTVGAEALARFKGPPDRPTERWFAEASEVGLRKELELAAARKAVSELSRLPANLYLSLNASPSTLACSAFRKLLTEMDAARIVVEMTEHAPVDDYDGLNRALDRLRALGARLAIDDAGAGFASLRHILDLAPDFIKLDRTLIAGIERDRSRQALAAGLISFAGHLGATIVAEGIERASEVEALIALGVGHGQGAFLGAPAPLPLSRPALAGRRAGSKPRSTAAA